MFRTHLVIALGAVLEIVAVAVAHELFPSSCHLSRGTYEVVLGPEVVGVICRVNALNIVQKLFKRLSIAILIEQ